MGISLGIGESGIIYFRFPELGLRPASVNAFWSGWFSTCPLAKSSSGYQTSIPVIRSPPEERNDLTSTSAYFNATISEDAKKKGSRPSSGIIYTAFTLPFTDCMASNCALSRDRGASCVSSAIIFDRCAVLIASSTTNKNTVIAILLLFPPAPAKSPRDGRRKNICFIQKQCRHRQ